MKSISFLYSVNVKNNPPLGFILNDNTIVAIENGSIDNIFENANVKKVIKDTVIEKVTWWWPHDGITRNLHAISAYGIINLFRNYGFSLSNNCDLFHDQVDKTNKNKANYMELILNVSDEKYEILCQTYGNIKNLT